MGRPFLFGSASNRTFILDFYTRASMTRDDRTKKLFGLVTFLALALLRGAPASSATEEPAAPAEKPTFDVLEYRVLGNSVLSARDVETAVYEYLGPGKTLDDVELARQSLENAYRAAGRGTVFVDI